jgi:toxin ParE1/3/4
MSLSVVLRKKARVEFDLAIDWYERREAGLGAEFVEQIQAVFDRIAAAPEIHATVYRDIRRALVRQFPYSVYYRIKADRLVVLAVFHNKRDPKIWKSRD